MKIWTVTLVRHNGDGSIDEVSSHAKSFILKHDAVQAVESHALNAFERMQDPNAEDQHGFPGLNWNDDFSEAEGLKDWPDGSSWTLYKIAETVLE